jgi:S-methylmethionine-dependent homocysteine/selenocysteine methylase
MGRRNAVKCLPDDVRDFVELCLLDESLNGFPSYEALADHISSLGYSAAKSSLQRYAVKLRSKAVDAISEPKQASVAAPYHARLECLKIAAKYASSPKEVEEVASRLLSFLLRF